MQGDQEKIMQIDHTESHLLITILPRRIYLDIADRFENELLSVLKDDRNRFIIDLSAVKVMNSAAIGVLLSARDYILRRDGKLIVCGLKSLVRQVFERMQLRSFFTVTETVQEARELIDGI
ncbi:STAS domain-containing protein [candidate division KSB1 bacterium]|nr:STAS domain-containing protein [candidate division KSB1 bacterium]